MRDSIDRFVGQCATASEADGVSQFVDLGVLLPVVVELLVVDLSVHVDESVLQLLLLILGPLLWAKGSRRWRVRVPGQ